MRIPKIEIVMSACRYFADFVFLIFVAQMFFSPHILHFGDLAVHMYRPCSMSQ